MSQITRCPSCATAFKVVADQLRISDGWVRCGQCQEVFDAAAQLLPASPESMLPGISLTDTKPPRALAPRTAESPRSWGAAPAVWTRRDMPPTQAPADHMVPAPASPDPAFDRVDPDLLPERVRPADAIERADWAGRAGPAQWSASPHKPPTLPTESTALPMLWADGPLDKGAAGSGVEPFQVPDPAVPAFLSARVPVTPRSGAEWTRPELDSGPHNTALWARHSEVPEASISHPLPPLPVDARVPSIAPSPSPSSHDLGVEPPAVVPAAAVQPPAWRAFSVAALTRVAPPATDREEPWLADRFAEPTVDMRGFPVLPSDAAGAALVPLADTQVDADPHRWQARTPTEAERSAVPNAAPAGPDFSLEPMASPWGLSSGRASADRASGAWERLAPSEGLAHPDADLRRGDRTSDSPLPARTDPTWDVGAGALHFRPLDGRADTAALARAPHAEGTSAMATPAPASPTPLIVPDVPNAPSVLLDGDANPSPSAGNAASGGFWQSEGVERASLDPGPWQALPDLPSWRADAATPSETSTAASTKADEVATAAMEVSTSVPPRLADTPMVQRTEEWREPVPQDVDADVDSTSGTQTGQAAKGPATSSGEAREHGIDRDRSLAEDDRWPQQPAVDTTLDGQPVPQSLPADSLHRNDRDGDEERDGADGEVAPGPEVSFVRAARRKAFWRRPLVRSGMALLALLALAALALQVAVQERDRIVALDARARPWLELVCVQWGCEIAPQRQIADVVIDSASFNKARGDSYVLGLTMKSRSSMALAMPAVELTLTDAQDQPVLRRVLLPTDMGAPAELAPQGEWHVSVSVIVTTGGARVSGYRLLAFYP